MIAEADGTRLFLEGHAMVRKNQRDAGVELARVFGCLIVVGIHTKLAARVGTSYEYGRILISCLFADGVAIFWFICGFFAFRSDDYARVLRRTLTHILLPAWGVGLISFYLYDIGTLGLVGSLMRPREEYLSLFESLLMWENPFVRAAHLWYVFTYALVMLCFPLLKAFSDCLATNRRHEALFVAISAGLLFLNDVTRNGTLGFSHHGFNAAIPAAVEVLYGSILYRHRERFEDPRLVVLAPAAFILVNVVRSLIQSYDYQMAEPTTHLSSWFSLFAVVCATLVIAFSLSFMKERGAGRFSDAVIRLGSYTYPVYLVHMMVLAVVERLGIPAVLEGLLCGGGLAPIASFGAALAYSAVMIALIFSLSLALCVVWRKAWAVLTPLLPSRS